MTGLEVIQWLFDLERISQGFNWPINVVGLIEAKRKLDKAVVEKAPANTVLAAYEGFAAAVGPTVMSALVDSDDAFLEVNHSGKPTPPSGGKVVLYVDEACGCVLAERTAEWGMPPNLTLG